MDNKIEKIKDIGHLDTQFTIDKLNEMVGMVNEHTDKLNEIIKKVNLNHKLIEELNTENSKQTKE